MLGDHLALALVGRIASHADFLSMQRVRQARGVMHIGGCGGHDMDEQGHRDGALKCFECQRA